MKTLFTRFIRLSILVALAMAAIPVMPVYAQSVTSVSPSTISAGESTIITISGSGFDNTSVVFMDGVALAGAVTDASGNSISVAVPADRATLGSHIITVTVGGAPAGGSANLTVASPTPIPPPPATNTPLPFVRPQFVVRSSRVSGSVRTGGNVTLKVVVENVGQATAYSAQAVFTSADLVSTKTGGVVAIGTVLFDDEVNVNQTFYVTAQILGAGIIVADMTITYYDDKGSTYSDKFTLSTPIHGDSSGGSGSAGPTATPTGVKSSQLVITNYSASVDPLQPGNQFALKMTVQNVGNAKAQRITMIVGGGSSGGSEGGTPQPGGVSGGGGEFTNFAPVGASNVQSLGDLAAGDKTQASQNLIVNVSTSPGAYPMKVTFSYLNDKNEVINDEQVITLLVYGLPSVDVSFYRPPDPFTVGQGGALPIQVVNLGKRQSVLGNIKITSAGGTVDNGAGLVGSLDPGGYFTIDSMLTPEQSGKIKLNIVIEYVDDFNQPRTIEKTIDVDVAEGFIEPTPDPSNPSINNGGGGGEFMPADQETTIHKIFRFVKGLFGLDSAWPVWQPPGGGGTPSDTTKPVIVPAGKG